MAKDPFQDESPLQPVSVLDSMYYGQQQPEQALAPVPQQEEPLFGDTTKKSEGFLRDFWNNISRMVHNRTRQYTPEELERFRREVTPPDFESKQTIGQQLENLGDVSAAGLQSLSYPLYKSTNQLPAPARFAARTLYGDMPLWAASLPSAITSSAGRMIYPVELAMKSDEDEGVVHAREKLLEKNEGLPWKPDDPANFVGLGTVPGKNFALGTFAGKEFAERLWAAGIKKPLETLHLAQQLEKEGKPPADIWMETAKINMAENNNYIGWEKKHGDWKLEVHDQATFNKEGPDVGKLTDSYRNPPVEKAIDLGDITLTRNPKEFGGEYNADFINPEIGVGTRAYTTKTQNPNIFGKEWSPRSVASHEVQHFIQDIERWQSGSNPDAILKGYYGPEVEARLRKRQLELYNDALESEPNAKLAPEEHQRAMLDAARKDAAFELYEKVAGEVEARNVQKRLDMTPEERLAKRPELTEDVPRDQQILDPAEQRVRAKAEPPPIPKDIDSAGYFSVAWEAAKRLPQFKGTPEQMLAQLKKLGAKDNEIKATGLDKFLEGKSSVTKKEIADYLADNRTRLTEVSNTATDHITQINQARTAAENEIRSALSLRNIVDRSKGTTYLRELNKKFNGDTDKLLEDLRYHSFGELEDIFGSHPTLLSAVKSYNLLSNKSGPIRWAEYSLEPTNPTYKETVLHLPVNRDPNSAVLTLDSSKNFQSGHWSEPNVVAHIRSSIQHTADGKKVFTLNELQSDWGQKIRDSGGVDGIADIQKHRINSAEQHARLATAKARHEAASAAYRELFGKIGDSVVKRTLHARELNRLADEAELRRVEYVDAQLSTRPEPYTPPTHPLVNTTDQWVNTALRNVIKQAVDAGADHIAIASGKTVKSFGMGGKEEGISYAYDKMYPKNLRNILQKIDPEATKATTVERLKSNDGTKDLGQGFTLFPITDKVRQTVQREGQPMFSKKRDKTAMDELREKYKAEEAQRYSPEETAVLTDMWDFVQTMKKVKEPERLSTWLVKEGGLKEYEGELNQLTDRNRRPGLMSQRGKDLDAAAQKAWEEGFLEGAERPTVNDLLNALDDDIRGNHVYRATDAETVSDLNQAKRAIEELRDHGIETKADIDRLRPPETRRSERASEEGIRRTEGQERSPRQGERVPEQVDIEDIIRRNLPPAEPPGPPTDKARIVPSQPKKDTPTFDKFYTMAKDDLHPIRRMEEALLEGKRGTLAEPDKSPYILSRLTRGLEGRVQQAIRYNMYRFKDMKNVGPGLEKILEPIKMKDREAFEQYLVYKRTLELKNRGIETGFDPRNAAEFVRKNARQFDETAKKVTRFAQQGLEYLRDSGVISKDAFTRMTESNKDYVPFYRLMEDGGDISSLPNTLRNPIKEIKGSERDVISPLESIVRNTYAFIGIAERNRALNAMKDLADANPAVGKQLMQRMVNKTEAKQMGHNGGPPLDAEVFKPDTFHPARDEIVLFRNGERQTYRVAPEVAEAVKNLNREELNWVVKAAAMPARWLRAGATLAPEFIARNPIRDQFSASILSNNNYVPLVSLVEGFVHAIMGGKSPQYQAALKGGGFNANLVSLDRKYINDNLMRLQDPTTMGRIKGVITSPVEALRKMSELMENATRMGEFLQARRSGKSIFNSAYDMREVTLDFARMGAKGRAMNAITAFWNANLEGTDRLGRAMWENPTRTSLKAAAGIMLPSALLWWATRDDERMKEVPKWERDTFWAIPMDDWQPIDADKAATIPKAYKRQIDGQWFQNKGEIVKIPKPFTEGILLGSGTERALEAVWGNDPKAWKHFGKSIKDAVIPGIVPTGALPILETGFGKSWFLDRDIVPKYLQRVDPKEQYNPYTSETAKFLGRQVAKVNDETSLGSPLVLEHIYRGYTGGLGRLALEGVEKGMELTGITDKKNWPTSKNADIPLLRAFASRHPSSSAESIQQFYDEYEKREKSKNTAKLLDTRGDNDAAKKVREERALANATSTHRQIGAMNKEVRRVYDDKKISPDDKREQIDLLYLKMINLAQKANEMFRATEKKPQSKPVIEDPFKVKIEDPFKQ